MADANDDDEPVAGLEGWGTPPARAGFVDRVLAREGELAEARRAGRRRAWVLPFAVGAAIGGVVVATALALRGPAGAPPEPGAGLHLQVPGVGEAVGEPGADVYWRRTDDARFVVVVDEGVAWVRVAEGAALELVAGGAPAELGGVCGRVAVQRSLLGVDVDVAAVDCARVDEAIARTRAELSTDRSR